MSIKQIFSNCEYQIIFSSLDDDSESFIFIDEQTISSSDHILLVCIVFAAICMSIDWLLSKEQKKQVRETVGDYWTLLQDKSLPDFLRMSFIFAHKSFMKIFGSSYFSLRMISISMFMQLTFSYVLWCLVAHLLSPFLHMRPKSILVPYTFLIIPKCFYIQTISLFYFALSSYISWSTFKYILDNSSCSRAGLLRPLLALLTVFIALAAITLIFFNILHIGPIKKYFDYLLDLLRFNFIEEAIRFSRQTLDNFSGNKPDVELNTGNNEDIDLQFNQLAGAFSGIFFAGKHFIEIMIGTLVLIFIFAGVFGPLVLFVTLMLSGLLINIGLSKLEFILKPIISLLLARLYDAEKGVITQIGVIIAAAVKLTDEIIKRI